MHACAVTSENARIFITVSKKEKKAVHLALRAAKKIRPTPGENNVTNRTTSRKETANTILHGSG